LYADETKGIYQSKQNTLIISGPSQM